MRGALEKLAGVSSVDVTPGNKRFSVVCDPEQIGLAAMLAALERAGEPAKPID